MCTTPRQLLPSVFGGNLYPRGLRRTLKLLTCPAATDNDAADGNGFCIGDGFGRKSKLFFLSVCFFLLKFHWMSLCTGVSGCACTDRCRPELVKTPTQANFFFMSWKLCSAMLYCRKIPGPSVTLPMKVNSLCAWTSSKFSHATTPTTYCRGTVSLSPALMLHIHQFQQFVRVLTSSQTTPWYNPLLIAKVGVEYVNCDEWSSEMCSMQGDNASANALKTALTHELAESVAMCLFESSSSSRVKTTLLFINASHQHKWRWGRLLQLQTYALNFLFFFCHPWAIASCLESGII